MRISELARAARVPLATVKFYLREGVLPPGHATSATQATYDETHLQRLRLIRSLLEVGGLPLAKVRAVLDVVDTPGPDPYAAVGHAMAALPPYVAAPTPSSRATSLLDAIGLAYDPDAAAVAQLDAALAGLEAADRPLSTETARRYAAQIRVIAEREVGSVEGDGTRDLATVVQDIVLGTVLMEPVILALRRLMHASLYREFLRDAPQQMGEEST
ncbi:MerR family transcriptional regulator [Microbacterium sp. zg.Y1090]|uniref:MerR family transcriptional regulator n=1 Tax=Microbacterium TaxID=33882 RepID=UPI00214D0E77|nr:MULTISPECIES: MerR family transcriptional regulator [unclassified Microbacterium]MCR2814067.1 MerR family transcriptional regulator [Microbacterium sp. zg.Y1084]MCR2817928.1 MerR family transcriptional regulator [Microbacterium sp. zg.Y1090]MDL5487782.1 MerR family transcriptional regulator [Microbacterium sp. zg-Y1211]WIM27907.1 MerR family transcriptional regulator [Microbacterium sp. zg-Y1090]